MVMHTPKIAPKPIQSDETFINIETTYSEVLRDLVNLDEGAVGGDELAPNPITKKNTTPKSSQIPIFTDEVVAQLNRDSAEKKRKAHEEKMHKAQMQQQVDDDIDESAKRKLINEQRAIERKIKRDEEMRLKKEQEDEKKRKTQEDREKRLEERRQRQEYLDSCKNARKEEEELEKERQREEAEKQARYRQNVIKKQASLDMYNKAKREEDEYLEEIKKQQTRSGAIPKSLRKNHDEKLCQSFKLNFDNDIDNECETGSQVQDITDDNINRNDTFDDELIKKIIKLNFNLNSKNESKPDRVTVIPKPLVAQNNNEESIEVFLAKVFNSTEQEIKDLLEKESEEIIESENFNNKLVNDSTKFNQTNKFLNCSEIEGKNKDNSLNIKLTLKNEIFDNLKDQNKFNNEIVVRFSNLMDKSSIELSKMNDEFKNISLKFFNLFYNVFKFQNECTNWVKDIMNSTDYNFDIITNETFNAFINSLHIPKFTNKQISDLYEILSKILDPFFSQELFNNYFNEFNNISENFRDIKENIDKVYKVNKLILNESGDSSSSSDSTDITINDNFNKTNKEINDQASTQNSTIEHKNEFVHHNNSTNERRIGVGTTEQIGITNAKTLARQAIENLTKTKFPEIFKVFVTINNKTAVGILDSGASQTLMTKEGAEFFNVKITDLKDGDFYSSGIAGNVNITGMSCISVALHDLQFPPIACRIIHGTSPDYFVTLGSDFLYTNKLIVNCANKSIGRQIAPDVYWELIVDLGKSSCRRRIVNLPIYLQNDLTTSKGNETITDFNIVLPDVKIVKNFSCACENETINKLNNFIYFSANNQTIDENLDDMLIDDVMTNIYYPQVSISNPSLELDVTLPRGTIIGKVTSPLCKVNDAEIPLRLNKNLETSDFDLHNQLHVEKFNKIKNNLNSNLIRNKNNILNNDLSTSNTEILNDDTLGEINCLKNIEILYSVYHEINSEEARYDFSPPEKGEYNREDE
ncbi:unnamed protein product, partial [Rotaria magnacalcarata]